MARLYPITILDGGAFHDATIYKNEPEPMTLAQGVVYEVQKTGEVVGYLTVAKATKEKENVWTALGKWQPPGAMQKARASATPPPTKSDERPILHRPGSPAASTPSPTPAPGAAASPTPAASPAVAAATPAPSPEATQSIDSDRPTLRRRTPQSDQATSGTVELPIVASTKPAAPTASTSSSSFSLGPGTQSLVAISDEQAIDTRSYHFVWKPGEEAAIDAKVRRLAVAQVPGLSERSLANVVVRSFDLDLSNDAVMVLSAEIPPAAASPTPRKSTAGAKTAVAAKSAPSSGVTRYITLIARVDFENNPQKLAFSITDSSRLDVAPRLELIDAADVDGDGFAELLFRQYSFDDKSYVIYQIGRSTVTKLFEGASQPLK